MTLRGLQAVIARGIYRDLLLALGLGLMATLLLIYLPQRQQSVLVRAGAIGPFISEGETPLLRNFFGFHTPESAGATAFRWTTGAGSFIIRNGDRLGAPLLLKLRLCGCRSEAAAPRMQLRVDGVTLAKTNATTNWGEWRRYALLVPPNDAPYRPDVLVELISDATTNPQSGRALGIAFEQAQLTPLDKSQRAYPLPVALGLGALLGALVLVARLRGFPSSAALWVALLGLGLIVAQGLLYRSQPLPAGVLALALLMGMAFALLAGDSPIAAGSLALGLSMLVLLPQWLGFWMLDDAFISFRYARNALFGHGLVFNPGERVEGYTNFLWTSLFVPIIGAGGSPAQASLLLTLLCALAIAALTWCACRRMVSWLPALAATAILVASAPFVLYSARGSGMETALFTLLVLGAILLYLTEEAPSATRAERPKFDVVRAWLVGVVLALAAMTRPEGILVAGICGLHLLLGAYLRRGMAWWRLIGLIGGFLIVFGPYYLWRFSYYGYPLPNTFYAKVGGTLAQVFRGADYTGSFVYAQAPLIAIALLSLWPTKRPAGATAVGRGLAGAPALLWMLVGVYTLYIVVVGGDHFPLWRFFVPLLPPLALLAALGLRGLQRWPAAAWLTPLLALLAIGWQVPQLYESRTLNAAGQVWGENSVVEKNREIGIWMRQNTPPDTLIATGIAGALPFYAERPVLDSLGLNDLHIAHLDVPSIGQGVAGAEKTDNAYVLSRRPAYIPGNSSGTFADDPLFRSTYTSRFVRGPEGRGMRLFQRNDLAVPK